MDEIYTKIKENIDILCKSLNSERLIRQLSKTNLKFELPKVS
jgi:hypothetical protein